MKSLMKLRSLVFIVSSFICVNGYSQDTCDDSLAILLPYGQDFISECDVVVLSQYRFADLSITKSKFDKLCVLYPEYKSLSNNIEVKESEKDSIQKEVEGNCSGAIQEVKAANTELQNKVKTKNSIIKFISGALIISVLLNVILTN